MMQFAYKSVRKTMKAPREVNGNADKTRAIVWDKLTEDERREILTSAGDWHAEMAENECIRRI